MREKERIDRILNLIKIAWENSPDQRLGQLLSNATDRVAEKSLWHIEDYDWEIYLRHEIGNPMSEKELIELEDRNMKLLTNSIKEESAKMQTQLDKFK